MGGRAEWLLEPANPAELRAAFLRARERGLSVRVLGGGANLVIDDGLIPGAVIATDRMSYCFRPRPGEGVEELFAPEGQSCAGSAGDAERLVAWCGASLPGLVRRAQLLGLSGLEGLAGVPGHLGGAVAMNAGGRPGSMWDVVEHVRVLEPDGTVRDLAREECAPVYRDGRLGERIVLGAVLRLEPAERAQVESATREYLRQKNAVQPVSQLSAGCTFKNPDPERSGGKTAARILDELGCKGLERGDALVSPLHANFIVNRGKARAEDVLALIAELQRRVAEGLGIELELEVQVWP